MQAACLSPGKEVTTVSARMDGRVMAHIVEVSVLCLVFQVYGKCYIKSHLLTGTSVVVVLLF